jgi:hypothetical protein
MNYLSSGYQYVEPPKGFIGINRWMNFNGYRVMVGSGRSPFFFNLISKIRHDNEACIIVITAKGGKGKSYLAARLGQILDKRFNPKTQIVFDRMQFLEMLSEDSPLRRGQVLVLDEAQFAAGSRNWHEQMQKDLMANLEAIRSRGLIIIFVVLGIDLLDIIIRKHVMNYRIHLMKRGTGIVYRYDSDMFDGTEFHQKLGEVRFLVPGWEQCRSTRGCLVCKYSGLIKGKWKLRDKWKEIGFKPCENIRNQYEIKKKEYIEFMNKASLARADEDIKKKAPVNEEEIYRYVVGLNPPIKLNRNGKPDREEITMRVEVGFPDIKVSRDKISRLAKRYELENNKNYQKVDKPTN